ncbi:MAG TPA: endonuclease III [Elusimicrobiales bacterium]|nr:endonuclease III [Elusimicrobiales bacterium]HOL62745.1 endonuclease III [Elusimicrobiales bacterium]HPO95477.1 endonuclease III [Elusimicrobiales bacterium]
MTRQERAAEIIRMLKKEYPEAKTELLHSNPFELLIATILSAQSTDKTINKITPVLFSKYPTPEKLSKADLGEVEEIIKSSGFYKVKAKNIIETSRILAEKFGGKVPDTMEDLLTLKGVARKTANVVLSNAFGKNEGVVVDTHVKRLSYRIGLSDNTDPEKIEKDLTVLFEKKDWGFVSNALIFHGRKICDAKKPKCDLCVISKYCLKRIK